jgi:hypothetical protein
MDTRFMPREKAPIWLYGHSTNEIIWFTALRWFFYKGYNLCPQKRKSPNTPFPAPLNSSLSQLQTASKKHWHLTNVMIRNDISPPVPNISENFSENTWAHIWGWILKSNYNHLFIPQAFVDYCVCGRYNVWTVHRDEVNTKMTFKNFTQPFLVK